MKRKHIRAAVLVFVFLALVLTAFYRITTLLLPVGTGDYTAVLEYPEKEIEIPLNSSTTHIAALLEEEGIIINALVFRIYARYLGFDQELQAGRYTLSAAMGMEEILQELRRGVVYKETVRFTVPEGFTTEQIGARLAATGLVDAESFQEACNQYQSAEFDFLEEIPPDVYFRLEGYLFPDTYEVHTGVTAEEIIALMLRRFRTVCDDAYISKASQLGLTLHEAITLASLVEKEGQVGAEMPLISAVFHNRLQNDRMTLLQSCATVQYALGETKPYLTNADLEVDSIYNTYMHPYLPPGPIGAPGQKALEAAVEPASVEYLYFVSKEDGSGAHYFSSTLQEHNRYKAQVQRNRN